jgi:molybdenum cofactor biosynthesis enzyme MoaA
MIPWFHHTVSTDGTAQPCCSWTSKAPRDRHEGFFHGELMRSLRSDFSNGIKRSECGACVAREAGGNKSWRMIAKDLADDIGVDAGDRPRVISMEVNLSNICNLRCRTCDGRHSSKWLADEQRLGFDWRPRYGKRVSGWVLDDDAALTVRRLEFLGGEPMLHQDEIACNIEKVPDLSRLHIDITTNGTVPMSDRMRKLLMRCSQVDINVSVDGLGRLNDYIRTDSHWDTVVSTIADLGEMARCNGNINLSMVSLVSVLNVNLIHELWQWYVDSDLVDEPLISCIPCFGPECYDARNLPRVYRSSLADRLLSLRIDNQRVSDLISGVVGYISQDGDLPFDAMRKSFSYLNGVLDADRGTSLESVNPEIHRLFR